MKLNNIEILELQMKYNEGDSKYELRVQENKLMEVFHCIVLKDDKPYGPVTRLDSRAQVIAWVRLMLGDYPSLYNEEDVA